MFVSPFKKFNSVKKNPSVKNFILVATNALYVPHSYALLRRLDFEENHFM